MKAEKVRKSSLTPKCAPFLTVSRYIEGNPVRAGLVETAADWVWSSHRGRCGLEGDALITPLPVPYEGNWRAFVDAPLTGTDLAKVRKRIERQTRETRGLAPQVPVPVGSPFVSG